MTQEIVCVDLVLFFSLLFSVEDRIPSEHRYFWPMIAESQLNSRLGTAAYSHIENRDI